jgi:hypothetical protein
MYNKKNLGYMSLSLSLGSLGVLIYAFFVIKDWSPLLFLTPFLSIPAIIIGKISMNTGDEKIKLMGSIGLLSAFPGLMITLWYVGFALKYIGQ